MGTRELNRNIVMTILNRGFIVYVKQGSTDVGYRLLSSFDSRLDRYSAVMVMVIWYEEFDMQHVIS